MSKDTLTQLENFQMFTIREIAYLLHTITSVFDRPDGSVVMTWAELPEEKKVLAQTAVLVIWMRLTAGEDLTPQEAHRIWMIGKLNNGWTHGKEFCDEKKTHPCIVPFEELPPIERLKDELWITLIKLFHQGEWRK